MLRKSQIFTGALLAGALLISGCGEKDTKKAFDFSPERIRADMAFLADDSLGGRDSGSLGHRVATNYMAANYTKMGLAPAGENGSYFQTVTLVKTTVNMDSLSAKLTLDGSELSLDPGKDYYVSVDGDRKQIGFSGDMVFVGHGLITADQNDYAGVDVKGKIAVALSSMPSSMSSEVNAHFSRSGDRKAFAKAQGAVGLLLIEPMAKGDTLSTRDYTSRMQYSRMHWLHGPEMKAADISDQVPSAVLTHRAAAKLFAANGKDLLEVLKAGMVGKLDGYDMTGSLDLSYTVDHADPVKSRNVVAKIEGTDPTLKNEYVVLTAHIDHVGTHENLAKSRTDKIHNGALDNASGTATLLEVARAFIASGKPKRSILLVSVTAEEKGLVGSDYFAHYPTVPKESMVANVNLDMPILTYNFSDVIAFGAEHSSFNEVMKKVADISGVKASPDPIPDQVLFVRSDHYRFVQQGIPSIFLMTGHGKTADGVDGGEMFMKFLRGNYHSPMDDMNQELDFKAAAKFAYVNYLIASEVANAPEKPQWKADSFFGNHFGKKK